jgi:hypothetical protein
MKVHRKPSSNGKASPQKQGYKVVKLDQLLFCLAGVGFSTSFNEECRVTWRFDPCLFEAEAADMLDALEMCLHWLGGEVRNLEEALAQAQAEQRRLTDVVTRLDQAEERRLCDVALRGAAYCTGGGERSLPQPRARSWQISRWPPSPRRPAVTSLAISQIAGQMKIHMRLNSSGAPSSSTTRMHGQLSTICIMHSSGTGSRTGSPEMSMLMFARHWSTMPSSNFSARSIQYGSAGFPRLRACWPTSKRVRSVAADYLRSQRVRQVEDLAADLNHEVVLADPAAEVMAQQFVGEIWEVIETSVNEQERLVLQVICMLGWLPRLYPALFPTIQDVYNTKRKALERLRHNHQLQAAYRNYQTAERRVLI